MAEVVCKDKNSYNLCSDKIKGDFNFTRKLLESYKDDVKFALTIYENYNDNMTEDENEDLTTKQEDEFFEMIDNGIIKNAATIIAAYKYKEYKKTI